MAAAAALELPAASDWAVFGTGWLADGEALQARLGQPVVWAEGERYPQAMAVAQLAAEIHRRGGATAPEQVQPVYLRDKVAETLAERAARTA